MDHEQKHGCRCGHHGHHHDHDHQHHHEHGENCCGHHHHDTRPKIDGSDLTMEETALLAIIAQYGCLPVTRFALGSSQEASLRAIALEPVAIDEEADTMEKVKQTGAVLSSLAEKGLIALDYDIPVDGYDYEGYRQSDLYRYFEETVAESRENPGFLFDTPVLEMGSMVLTELGAGLVK